MVFDEVSQNLPQEIWQELRYDTSVALAAEPVMAGMLAKKVLEQDSLARALASRLAYGLSGDFEPHALFAIFNELLMDEALPALVARDMQACRNRDPACRSWLQIFLFFKGFAALQTHRLAHRLWHDGKQVMAYYLQNRASELWQVDIHPAAELGAGMFIDHATGVVIGETCVVGSDVTVMHGVTLGGNGKERGDRHPKIGDGVLLSVGAKVLGNISVGDRARVAAGSVVLQDVAAHSTVAGIPARPVGTGTPQEPAECMDHAFSI